MNNNGQKHTRCTDMLMFTFNLFRFPDNFFNYKMHEKLKNEAAWIRLVTFCVFLRILLVAALP